MAAPAPQMYPPQQMQHQHQSQPYQMQYQPPPAYPYAPSATHYANSLISAYGQLPAPPPQVPQQLYAYDQPAVGAKRSSDDVLQAVDLLSKRPRPDSTGTIGVYPQRKGEKLCAFYMTTRTCSFGLSCKFDHPSWVPFGGIPNWKEVTSASGATTTDPSTLPQREGEQICTFYMKTGDCKYGLRCKFHHPIDRSALVSAAAVGTKEDPGSAGQTEATTTGADGLNADASGALGKTPTEKAPVKAGSLNTKGLPIRLNETECTFYIKTGSCKFGVACRYHHPEVIRAGARAGLPIIPPVGAPVGMAPAVAYGQPEYGMTMMTPFHPQRPGGPDCAYYLKTGECSFGLTCRFHHPPNRQPSTLKVAPKLTLAGLPRREGETVCAYYMKTGACKYGSTCRFDHPPPGEVAAKVAAEATRSDGPPGIMEPFDIHQAQGVPLQYVDLNLIPAHIKNAQVSGAIEELISNPPPGV